MRAVILAVFVECDDGRMPVYHNGSISGMPAGCRDGNVRGGLLPQVEGAGAHGTLLRSLCVFCIDLYDELITDVRLRLEVVWKLVILYCCFVNIWEQA